jgi:LIVCS family branched-chain amino acid:cation transporter
LKTKNFPANIHLIIKNFFRNKMPGNLSKLGSWKAALIAGFAMFTMFFGSGNLVFPLYIGTQNIEHFYMAFIGLIITGVLLPFSGLYSMIMLKGDRDAYFDRIGRIPSFMMVAIMLSLMGPFGVLPRCIIVAHTGIELIFPELSLHIFAAAFCVLAALVIWNHHYVVEIIGKWLTPFLAGGLLLLIIFGIIAEPKTPTNIPDISIFASFKSGVLTGYQTMDLLAGFFFGITTIEYLYMRAGENRLLLNRMSTIACIVGGSLLALVYLGFVYLGSKYSSLISDLNTEKLLISIAYHTLGEYAAPVIGVTIAMACFTTGVVLTLLFSEFFAEKINIRKLNRHVMIIITLAIAYAMTFLGFAAIASFLATILVVLYPALIALAFSSILDYYLQKKWLVPLSFYGVASIAIVLELISVLT